MKKTSTVVSETKAYEIDILINNTAYIKSVTGKTGLLNIKTNEIIGDMDYYYTIYDTGRQFYSQEKTIQESTKENGFNSIKSLRVYDCKKEEMIVDGWVVAHNFDGYYGVAALVSPVDNKLHLLDKDAIRANVSIFDKSFDNIEHLYSYYNDVYYVVTSNGKKGLYQAGKGLITPIIYDDIEKKYGMTIYTKDNKNHFVCDAKGHFTSPEFDSIKVDQNRRSIVYCKRGNTTYVYNIESEKLLLTTDQYVEFLTKLGDMYNEYNGEWIFTTMDPNKKNLALGLISVRISPEIRNNNECPIVTKLVEPLYDHIEYNSNRFYLKQGNRVGIFVGDSENNEELSARYDDIDYLGDNYYVLHSNGLCEIGKMTQYKSFNPVVRNCELIESNDMGIVYKKDGKYGLIITDRYGQDTVIPNEYDSMEYIAGYYFIVQKDGKYGLMHKGKILIPIKYDELKVGGEYSKYRNLKDSDVIYFALKSGDSYRLAKMNNWHYVDTTPEDVSDKEYKNIELYRDVYVLTDDDSIRIYNYQQKLLKSVPVTSVVKSLEKKGSDYDERYGYKSYIYSIDGVHYYYKDGKFEEVMIETNEHYITTYETENDSFEISTYSKDSHDKFCETIDGKSEEEAISALIDMSTNGTKGYPGLKLERKPKEQK